MVSIQRRGRRTSTGISAGQPPARLEVTRIFLPLPLLAFRDSRLLLSIECVREEVQVPAIPRSGGSGRRQALCGFRAGSLGAARAGCRSLFGLPADPLSLPSDRISSEIEFKKFSSILCFLSSIGEIIFFILSLLHNNVLLYALVIEFFINGYI